MSSQAKGTLLVILSAVVFGMNPLLSRHVYAAGGTTFQLTFLRAAFALPMLFALVRAKRGKLRVSANEVRAAFLLSLLHLTTGVLLFGSYNFIPTGLATTLHFTYPVMVVLGCILFLHEKPTAVKLLCTALCTAGIVLFYEPGGAIDVRGIAIALTSGVTYAGYTIVLGRSAARRTDVFTLAFWVFLFDSISGFALLLVTRQAAIRLAPDGWLWAAAFALLNVVVASVCYQIGVKRIGPQRTAILSTFEPITAAIVGVLVYAEPFTLRTALGSAAILAAVLALTIFDKSE